MKSHGRAPSFLLATGHEQVRSIAAALSGHAQAAAHIELEPPEIGICVSRPAAARAVAAARRFDTWEIALHRLEQD
jgi:hypothetical protein